MRSSERGFTFVVYLDSNLVREPYVVFLMSLFLTTVRSNVVRSGPRQRCTVTETKCADAWPGPERAQSDDWPMGGGIGMACRCGTSIVPG